MDTSYGIFKYDINVLGTYISYQTNTSLRSIKEKSQLVYLDNYLSLLKNENENIAFVYENEYIDRHYTEDYSLYYVRSFYNYRKTCSRIHFFKFLDDGNISCSESFDKALNNEETFINSDNYLGYIIIRPIPQVFLATVCLKTLSSEKRHFIKKQYDVSLFGIQLTIETIAFQEQDQILSACATTALWSFYHAHPYKNNLKLPSASNVTKSAYNESHSHYKEFPNKGLSIDMICTSLKNNNLEPEYFDLSDSSSTTTNLLKEYIYSYTSSKIPLIFGIEVRDSNNGTSKGLHAITVLGYALDDNSSKQDLISHKINKIYVHDDRFGPYLKMKFEDQALKVSINKPLPEANLKEFEDEIYIPDTIILGLYHKIRIPYIKIKNTCIDLKNGLNKFTQNNPRLETINLLIENIEWDIKLKLNNHVKQEILHGNNKDKKKYLLKSFPKYIWSSTAVINDTPVFELLFDATDIDHGNVFLDIISFNIAGDILEDLIRKYTKEYFANKTSTGVSTSNIDSYLWGIVSVIQKQQTFKENLSDLYGYLKIPKYIKDKELKNNMFIDSCDAILNRSSNSFSLDKNIDKNMQYIWVVDEDGFLRIGKEEIKENKKESKGHPTLTGGMPARVGGQLTFDTKNNIWIVDPFSGRYSSVYSEEDKFKFTSNAIKYLFEIYIGDNFKIKEVD